MPYCPNCGDEIVADASSCPACEAVFGPTSAWHPLVEPPAHRDLQRIADLKAATDRRRQKREREAQAAVEEAVPAGPHRSPIFGILSLLIPLASFVALFVVFYLVDSGALFKGGNPIVLLFFITLILLGSGFLFGATAAFLARLRNERWLPLQVCGGLINGAGVLILLMAIALV